MKKIFTLILLLVAVNTSFSQVIFYEDFDIIGGPTAGGAGTYTFPSGWLLRNVDNRTPDVQVGYINEAWERREDFQNNVLDSVAFSTSWYSPVGAADDWMWTPPITIAAQCELSWNAKAYDPEYPDGYEVRIMVAPDVPTGGTGVLGNQVSNSTVLFTTANETTSWVHRTVDLTAYEGQTVRIAFRNMSNNLFILVIDDVMVESLLDYDAAITAHSRPSEYSQIPLAQNFEFIASATINSSGTQNFTSLTLTADVYDANNNLAFTTSETVNGTYAPGSNTVITASTPFVPTDTGTYTIEYSIQTVPPDQASVNDYAFDSFVISDSTFARDKGDPVGSLGIGSETHPGYLGQHYVLNQPATLTSVSMYLTGLPAEGDLQMAVFDYDNGYPTTILYQTPESFIGPLSGWVTFAIPGGLALDADTFVVTAVEIDSTLSLGQTTDIFTTNTTWVDWPANFIVPWGNNEDFGGNFAKPYMIRANFSENFAPDFIAATSDTSVGVCANPVVSVLDGLLQVTDGDDDQTLTWDIATAPQFGTVSGFPFSTAATGGTVIPSGLGYTPNPGYEDYDTIKVSVSDGIDTDTIQVVINAGDPEPGTTWYLDADNDGYYGDAQASCESPGPGYSQVELADEDCDDNDPDVNPGVVTDLCDGVDNDCDGNTDEDFVGANSCITCQSGIVVDDSPTWYQDGDGDGYYTGSPVTQCESPGAGYTDETPLGGDDCNDENDLKWISVTYYIDSDEDGYDNGSETFCSGDAVPGGYSSTTNGSDCNDENSNIHEAPVVTISPSEDQMVCPETTVQLTASINTYYFNGNLLGGNSVPPLETTGSGNFSAIFDATTGELMLDLEYSNLLGTATDGHIHMAPAGVNGPVIIPFTGFTTGSNSGSYAATLMVPPGNVADLLAGNTYINIHSTAYAGGEIRGQLVPILTWEWSTSATTSAITAGPGDYTVSASVYGCTGSAGITVLEDTVKPVAICQNITIQLGEDGYAEISVDDLNNGSTDNCGIASLSVDFTGFGCAELGENTMTLTVTDNSGNSSTCDAIVTVADTIDPEFLTGPPIPVPELLYYSFNGSGTSEPNLASNPPSGTETATIMGGLTQGSEGLCGGALIGTGASSLNDYLNTGWTTSLPGDWTISFWAKGDFNSINTRYVFGDFSAGELRCFTNGVAGTGNWILRGGLIDIIATGGASAEGAITTFVYSQTEGNIKAYVNGVLVNTVAQGSVVINGTGPFKVGGYNTSVGLPSGALMDEFRVYNRALSVEEIGELANICETVAGCPENITTTADAGVCSASVDYTAPEAVDNCEDVTVEQTAGLPSGSDFPVGTTTNIFTATDASGNVATCSFDVIVTDNESPTAVCQNVTAYLDENGLVTITGEDVDNGSSDACGIASLSVSPDNFDCEDTESPSLVTLTVTDVNNNTSTCTANVTVLDTIDPVAICQDITIQLDEEGVAEISGEDINNGSTDACGIESVSVDPSVFYCEDVGENTVTLTVTDVYGNTSTCEATVTVEDDTNPDASCQNVTVTLDENGTATVTGAQVNDGSTDACGIESLSVSPNTFTCNEVGDNTVTLTVTDANGNTSTCEATVTVEDNTNPVATCQAVTVWLDENGEALVTGEQVDNGSTDLCGIESLSVEPSSFSCDNVGGNTVLLTVTDVNGNTAICEAIVTVLDTVSPVITCPEDITVNTDEGLCSAVVNYDLPLTSDNCAESEEPALISGLASGSVFPVGTTTNTYTITDASGNTATCSFDVVVEDNENPTVLCQPVTVSLDENGNASVTPAQVNNGSNDACGIESLSVSPNTFTCTDAGENTVTLTVTDVNGNTSTCEATVTVEDNTNPVAVCQGITVQLDEEGAAEISAQDIDNGSSDICGIESLSLSQSEFNCSNVGTNTVILTVTDVNGNTSGCEATVTVEDNVDPVAVCQNITVSLNEGGSVTISGEQVNDGSSDACGIESMSVSPNTFTCEDVGDNTVTLTVTDVNGNTATCTSTVTVEDNTNPVALCQNITVQLDENGEATITGADIDNGSSDLCGIASLSVSPDNFDCDNVGIEGNLVTLTVTDVNGNSSTCTANITVQDNIDPVAVCQAVTIQLDENGNGFVTANQVNDGSSDACGIAALSVSPNEFNCNNVGDNTVTLTVTDVNGNTSTCEATVTVEDNVAPDAVCQTVTIQLDENGNASVDADVLGDGSTDACGIESFSVSAGTFDCDDVGENTVTVTVTDVNGNSSACEAVVTVEDNINPAAVCQNVTIQLDASGNAVLDAADVDNGSSDVCGIASMSVTPSEFTCNDIGANSVLFTVTDVNGNSSSCEASVTVEDNVDPVAVCQPVTIQLDENGEASVSTEQINNGSSDACGIASMQLDQTDFDCSNLGANTVTLTVTDNNGNSNTCTATVTVEDNIDPVAVCQSIILELDENGNVTLDAADIDNGSTDNCGVTSMSVDISNFDCLSVGENAVTLTVFDNSGNSDACIATITIVDNVSPVVSCQNITVELDANGEATITAADLDNGSSDACGIASLSASQTSFDCSDIGANAVILTVTDNNGNTSSCEATVTVEDNIDPVLTVSEDITACSGDENGSEVTYDAPSYTDNCSATITQTAGLESGALFPVGVTTNTFEVTDAGGNTVSSSFTVTVNPPPVVDFTATNACSDSPIVFENTSTVSTGTIEEFDWDFGDGATSTDENPSHQYATDSTYSVTLTITTDGGCTASVTHDVTANPVPTFILETTNVSCNGAGDGKIVVVVDNGPGPFYHSLNGGAEQELNTFTGLQPGSYTVTSRNQYNCTHSQTVTVTQPAPLTVALIDSSSTDCSGEAGGSLRFVASGGTPPYQYYLDGSNVNHSSGIFNNITGGLHTVSVTDANGCTLSAVGSVPVSLGLPVAGFTIDLNGFEVEFNNISVGATNYHWEFGDGPGSSGVDPTHIYTTPGIYTVMLIASNECGSDTAYFTVDMTTGINTPDEDGYSINVFPNPNNGSFTMMLESAGFMDELSVRLWTVEGKLIDDMIVAPGGNTYTRNFSYQLAAGIYVLEVSDKNTVQHKQIIIK